MSVLDVCNANMDDDELFLDNATDAGSEATTPAPALKEGAQGVQRFNAVHPIEHREWRR